jgi:serine/threonine protein kinase
MADEPASDPSFLDPASRRVGTVLDGKWKLDRLLGVGGMAAVYAATHRNGALAAIKLFPFSVTTSAEFAERILREGYLANKIGHPAIVRVLDDHLDREREYAYLVMELLEGETARQRVERGGPMSPLEAVEFSIELADCLAAAHEKGVVHRDIKPENLFLTEEHHLKILDFGVARAMDSTSSSVTRTGAMLGTPAYMSPEQARGRPSELSPRSDIYSAGATLLFLVAGEFVHEGESAQEVMVRAAWTPPKKMRERKLGIPESIAAVIDRACEFDPKDRYQTAGEMRLDLDAAHTALLGDPRANEPIARTSKIPPGGPLHTAPLPLSRPTPASSAEQTVADRTPPPAAESRPILSASNRRMTLGFGAAVVMAMLLVLLLRPTRHAERRDGIDAAREPAHMPSKPAPAPEPPVVQVVPVPVAPSSEPLPKVTKPLDAAPHQPLGAHPSAARAGSRPHAPAIVSAPAPSAKPPGVATSAPARTSSVAPPGVKSTGRDVGY